MNEEHPPDKDRLVLILKRVIRMAVRVLAVMMTAVILWGVADVVFVIQAKVAQQPFLLLNIHDILQTFGAFMAVLIAIEIFVNITIYLRDDVIHVKIVMATALLAVARKVIVLDLDKVSPPYIFGLAAIVLAMSVGYWLVVVYDKENPSPSIYGEIFTPKKKPGRIETDSSQTAWGKKT